MAGRGYLDELLRCCAVNLRALDVRFIFNLKRVKGVPNEYLKR